MNFLTDFIHKGSRIFHRGEIAFLSKYLYHIESDYRDKNKHLLALLYAIIYNTK